MTSEKLTPPPTSGEAGDGAPIRPRLKPSGGTERAPRGSALARVLADLREAGGMGGGPGPAPTDSGGERAEPARSPVRADLPSSDAAAEAPVAQDSLTTGPVMVEPAAPESISSVEIPRMAAPQPAQQEGVAAEPTAAEPTAAEPTDSAPADEELTAAGRAPRRSGPAPGALDNTLTATIRRWAKPTTPQELEARGVKRVRSVSMSRIASLIEKAINRELIARTLEGDSDDALSLSANARAGFLELARNEMSGQIDAEAESSAFANLDRLRTELEARRAELEEREHRMDGRDHELDDASLEQRLRDVFVARPEVGDPALEREVVRVALQEVGAMRARAQGERQADRHRETHQLERRIAKLAGLLEQTEGELRRTRASRAEDMGVASMFEEVQGLDGGDERFGQKRDLMKSIFEANLELQH